MAIQPGVWGIDLGQCALKALRLEVGEDGGVVATAFDYVEHPKILSQPDADPDQLTREALEKFLSRNTLRGDHVAISVPGQSGLARFVKLPPVEEKKIVDIVRFEAKQQIPFNLEEVVWDYQKLSSGAVADGFAMETEIGLFAMKRDMVNRYLQHFRDVNVEVHLVQMAPLSLCNYVSYDLLDEAAPKEKAEEGEAKGKKQCVVALDIGADSSNLVITDGARIIWQRPIPLGGNHFTRSLTKDMKLTFAKAEHLKRNATKSPDLKQILSSLKPVLNDFVGEVQRSLGYFTNTHRDAHIRYMVGLGNAFRLPGLQRFLGEKLQMEVRKLQKLNRLSGDGVITAPAYTENVLSFAVAYGLGLQGLKLARLHTNLLPPEIQVDRMIRAKKPWAAAAAAALLIGATSLAAAYGIVGWAFGGDAVKAAEEKSDQAVKKNQQLEAAFKAQQDKVTAEENAVRSIIAGREEMPNWLSMNKFIDDALPRPDATSRESANLWGTEAQRLYLNDKARQAYQRYLSKLGGEKALAGSENESDKDLILVNIEAVDARWSDDLPAYWSKVKAALGADKKGYVRPVSHWDAAPKEKENGWVVEIRGTTFHEDANTFLRETLVENLALYGIRETPKTADAAAKPEDKKNEGPVLNKISHVVLFKVNPGVEGGSFSLGSEVVTFLGGGGSGGGGPGLGGGSSGYMAGKGMTSPMPGMGGGGTDMASAGAPTASGGRSTWSPLGTSLGGGSGTASRIGSGPTSTSPAPGGAGSGGMTAPLKGISPTTIGGSGGSGSGGLYGPGGTSAPGVERQPGQRLRTDFVILFIWKEPIPSDKLRFPNGEPPPPEPKTTTGPGMSPGMNIGPQTTPPPAGGGGSKGDDDISIKRGS